jgi:diamine N-acetyltransferase
MIALALTQDAKLIAQLNEEVQNLHAALHPDFFKPHHTGEMEKALIAFLNAPKCFCYVAKEGEISLGYALFFIREIPENAFHYSRKILYIDQICVLHEHRKKGVGKLLLQQAEKLAAELFLDRIELDHWTSNSVAAEFFRANGYQLFREHLHKTMS